MKHIIMVLIKGALVVYAICLLTFALWAYRQYRLGKRSPQAIVRPHFSMEEFRALQHSYYLSYQDRDEPS